MADFYSEIVSTSGTFKYYVNGAWRESSSGKAVTNTNPSSRTTAFSMQGTRSFECPRVHRIMPYKWGHALHPCECAFWLPIFD